jgi:hypothetical protein
LVIGIGEYPAQSGWSKINGDNDIDIVCSFLSDNGFQREEIVTLENNQATKANIIRQVKSITAAAQTGDHIYIHFSGHGQQITDTNGDEEVDSYGERWDEAWIPYDAKKSYAKGVYEGENHLVDDQLNELLRDIRKKIGSTGKLTVVADACHSGDSSRGEEDEEEGFIVRGTPIRFEIPQGAAGNKIPGLPIEWVMISACKSYANNYECRVGDKQYGSLSYSLYSNRVEIIGRPFNVVKEIISESVLRLSQGPIPQTAQVDAPDSFSNMIVFDGR